MKILFNLTLIVFFALLLSCGSNSQSQEGTTGESVSDQSKNVAALMDGNVPVWAKNANMYEVNIRQFTPEGTFSAFATHIPRLKKMGVDILWLMPVYPISETKKKGSLGSYYAVSDFAKVNPEFGTLAEFQAMVDAVHAAGMKIILDFVPNHTGWDHVWITEHPNYYSKDADGNIVDPIDPSTGKSWGWTDVADLNFDNAEMRKAMIDDMLYWIEEEQIDGYRMDVAHGVPVNFWGEVSSALTNAKPDIFMLAESEVEELRNKDYFQTDYGWEFHHIINDIAKGTKNPTHIKEWYESNQAKYNSGWHIQFTSNHDENSWAGSTKERMGDSHDALAALAYTIEGMPLIYGGQEEPLEKRLEFFEKDDIGFGKYEKADFFAKILKEKHQNKALWNGEFGGKVEFIHVDEQVLVYKRVKDGDIALCLFNLSDKPASFMVKEAAAGFRNVMTGESKSLTANSELNLEPWEYAVLSNK
jgi:glycosidase